MKHLKKKLLPLALAAICLLSLCLVGCETQPTESTVKFTRFTDGDFFGRIYEKSHYSWLVDKSVILGLTYLGQNKKILVVPKIVGGYPFLQFGVTYSGVPLAWESEVLEKVFIEPPYMHEGIGRDIAVFTTKGCPNLKKVILIGGGAELSFQTCYLSERGFFRMSVTPKELYHYSEEKWYCPANISYYFNYEESPNDGYYWLDDVDYGGLIDFIPTAPLREGYEFAGWFKEADCSTLWDFETDTIPEEIRNDKDQVKYQETILYAKWIEV